MGNQTSVKYTYSELLNIMHIDHCTTVWQKSVKEVCGRVWFFEWYTCMQSIWLVALGKHLCQWWIIWLLHRSQMKSNVRSVLHISYFIWQGTYWKPVCLTEAFALCVFVIQTCVIVDSAWCLCNWTNPWDIAERDVNGNSSWFPGVYLLVILHKLNIESDKKDSPRT